MRSGLFYPLMEKFMINNLQILRAFAALNVVLFHIIETSPTYNQGVVIFKSLEGWGSNGVDIFFIISGFVMAYTQAINPKRFSDFIVNRIVRIVPIYWLLTSVLVAIYFVLPSIFREIKITLEYALSSYFFVSQVFQEQMPLLYIGWTLEWEMLFYLIFALAIFCKNPAYSIAVIVVLLSFICFYTGEWLVLEFALGIVAATLYQRVKLTPYVGLLILVLGVLLLLASIHYTGGMDRLFKWGIPSFLIVLGALYAKQMHYAFLEYLGAASYSIYLIQVFSISAFYKVSSKFFIGMNGDVIALICLLFSAILGCCLYSFCEKPLTLFLRKRFIKRKA